MLEPTFHRLTQNLRSLKHTVTRITAWRRQQLIELLLTQVIGLNI